MYLAFSDKKDEIAKRIDCKMLKFNLIVAVCENFGIGINGDLPWRLKSELKYFSATTKSVSNVNKRNALIMGRKTYFGVPAEKRPLPGRLNIVLSTTITPNELPEGVLCFPNLETAMEHLETSSVLRDQIENIWIVGGSGVYKEAMNSPRCHRLYLTKIKAHFDCDTFFPDIPNNFKEIKPDAKIPTDIQRENGIEYEYKVLEKQQ